MMKAKKELNYDETRHLERLMLTTVAIAVVLGSVLIKAMLLGEFNWLMGR